jgi:hypothetical protein
MAPPINFDNISAEEASTQLRQRGEDILKMVPVIANHLAIAQHRDKLRYAQTRSGSYLPMVRKFSVGDFVYLRRPATVNTLQITATQLIVRILALKLGGTVVVQGRCGTKRTVNINSIAPCHLPHLDGTVDPELAMPPADLACEVCGFPDDDDVMLLCDNCNSGWHTYCLTPELEQLPPEKEPWLCPNCIAANVTFKDLGDIQEVRARRRALQPVQDRSDLLFRRGGTKPADKAAAKKAGMVVHRKTTRKGGVEDEKWGVVMFRGEDCRPEYFLIQYEDGSSEIITDRGLRALRPLPAGTSRVPDTVTHVIQPVKRGRKPN